MSRKCDATSRQHFRNRPSLSFMMLALWMAATFLRLSRRAYSKAARAIRIDAFCVMIFRLSTTPGTTSCSRPEYRSSVFSRKMARSSARSRKARLQAGQHAHRPEIHVQAELLAQRHVDALVAAADRRGGGTLQSDAGDFERGEDVVGNQLALFGERARAGFHALPFDRDAGRIHRAHGGVGHFRSDAVAGDERDLMGHHSYYRVGGEVDSGLGRRNAAGWWRRNFAGAASATSACSPPCCRFRARSSFRSNRASAPTRDDAAPDRLRPDHLAALHDRADGAGTGTEGRRIGARSGRRLRLRGGGAGRAGGARDHGGDHPRTGRARRAESARAPAATATSRVVPGDGSWGCAEWRAVRRDLGGGRRSRDSAGAARAARRPRTPGDPGGRLSTIRNCAWSASTAGGSSSAWPRCAASCRCAAARAGD